MSLREDKNISKIFKQFEENLKNYYNIKVIGLALVITLPPSFIDVHGITNFSRSKGIKMFRKAADKMENKNG